MAVSARQPMLHSCMQAVLTFDRLSALEGMTYIDRRSNPTRECYLHGPGLGRPVAGVKRRSDAEARPGGGRSMRFRGQRVQE